MLLVYLYVYLACVSVLSVSLPLGVRGRHSDCDTRWTFHLTLSISFNGDRLSDRVI